MSKKSTQEAKIINKQDNFVGPFFSSEVLHRLFLLDQLFFGSASAFFVIGCCNCCWKLLPRILIMQVCMYVPKNLRFSSCQDPGKCKSFCLFFVGLKTPRKVVYPSPLFLYGIKLPWRESAVHLGHHLHQNLKSDADAGVRRAAFIARSVNPGYFGRTSWLSWFSRKKSRGRTGQEGTLNQPRKLIFQSWNQIFGQVTRQ